MINRSKNITLFWTAALLTGCCLFISCENDVKQVDDLTKKVVMKEKVIGVQSYLSENGEVKAKLTAPLMWRVYADTVYIEFPHSLHVDFYKNKKIDTRLDCKYGKYFEQYNKVLLQDSVLVITIKGDTLKSPELWWNQNTGMFYTDKYAIYHSAGQQIVGGKGLEATQDLSSVTFHSPTGTVKVSENGFPK